MLKKIKNGPVFVFDFDDTLAYTNGPVLEMANEELGGSKTIDDITCWGHSGDAILDKRMEFFSDPEVMGNLPIRPGAQKLVKECSKRGTVYFCTAVEPECMEARVNAIKKAFGAQSYQIILASDKSLIECDYFLDDNPENIKRSAAKYPVLMRQPWNNDVSGIMSISKYEDFLYFVDYNEEMFKRKVHDKENEILCIVGPSGSGKTEVFNHALNIGYQNVPVLTTKEDSGAYTSITIDEFHILRDNGDFAEYTVYCGAFYGILKKDLETLSGKAVVPLDLSGAIALKNLLPERVRIIFKKASQADIYRNILNKEISEDERVLRLMSVEYERANKKFCEYSITEPSDIEKI